MSKTLKKNNVYFNNVKITYGSKKELREKLSKKTRITDKTEINLLIDRLTKKKPIQVIHRINEDGYDIDRIENIDLSKNFKDILKQKFDVKKININQMIEKKKVNTKKRIIVRDELLETDMISTLYVTVFIGWGSINPLDEIYKIITDTYGIETTKEYSSLTRKLNNILDSKVDVDKKIKNYFITLTNIRSLEIDASFLQNIDGIFEKKYPLQIPLSKRFNIANDPERLSRFVAKDISKKMVEDYYKGGVIYGYTFNTLTYVKTPIIANSDAFIEEAEKADIIDRFPYYLGNEEYTLEDWVNIQNVGKWIDGEDSCVVKFINAKYSKLYNEIKKYETESGISVKDFSKFCNDNEILYIFYDICGNEILNNRNKFEIITLQQENKALRSIIYNNHIYPFSGKKLKRAPLKPLKTINTSNIEKKLLRMIEKHKIPARISAYSQSDSSGQSYLNIKSFISSNIKYFENSEYDRCVKILSELGYDSEIPLDIKIVNLVDFISKNCGSKSNLISFFPQKELYKSKAILFQKKGIDKLVISKCFNVKNISGIDKNKCYPFALCELPYLIYHDWRKHNVKNISRIKNYEIVDHYLYLVDPKYFSILIPHRQIYPGYHLKKANNHQYELLEEYETETSYNYYREIVHAMYKVLNNNEFKQAMVILIGKFERNIKKNIDFSYNGIYNDEDSKQFGGIYKKIGKMNIHFNEKIQYKYVCDNLPISLQVKSKAYELLSDKIIELQIPQENIIQINTDSIFFIDTSSKYKYDNFSTEEHEKMKQDFNGWKILKDFKSSPSSEIICKNYFPETLKLKNQNNNSRILHMKYAGNGKTHYIVKELVPKLKKEGKTYIVLTPTHSTLEEYKNISDSQVIKEKFYVDNKLPYDKNYVGEINCGIIQEYCFNNSVPEVDYVIIDEIGFCGSSVHEFIYKLNYLSKSYECFGDFNQLLPVGESIPFNQKHYINYMFSEIRTEYANFRNNFTKEFYNSIITSKYIPLEIVLQYSTPIKKIDFTDPLQVCICYRNKTRDVTNELILKQLGLKENSIGVRLLCVDNLLRKYQIWNNTQFTITKKSKTSITLTDSNNKSYKLKRRTVKAHFRPAYCINVYSAQGKSLNAYNWIRSDDFILSEKFAENIAYTIVSRLIHKKTEISTTLLRANQRIEEIRNTANNINWNNIFNK